MASFEMDDRKKIGLGLTGFGIFFTFLGVVFLFDKGLLAMGNILFLSGVALTIGPKSTLQFFVKPQNYKGTISFGVGFFFVIIGWPILGMILESYGFIILFSGLPRHLRELLMALGLMLLLLLLLLLLYSGSGFWPTIAVFLQRIPLLGWVLQHPFFRSLMDRYRGKRVPV